MNAIVPRTLSGLAALVLAAAFATSCAISSQANKITTEAVAKPHFVYGLFGPALEDIELIADLASLLHDD